MSLAGLGLGFQQRHFALFALAAVTGAAFWYLDGLMKGYEYRYYVRMREIEYTCPFRGGLLPAGFYAASRSLAGSGGSQGLPARAVLTASRAVRPWAVAESR